MLSNLTLKPGAKFAVRRWQMMNKVVVVRGQFFEPFTVEQQHAQGVVGRAARRHAGGVFGGLAWAQLRVSGGGANLGGAPWLGWARWSGCARLPEVCEVCGTQATHSSQISE